MERKRFGILSKLIRDLIIRAGREKFLQTTWARVKAKSRNWEKVSNYKFQLFSCDELGVEKKEEETRHSFMHQNE